LLLFFLGKWLDPEVVVVVLVLPKKMAPNPPAKPAFMPKFDWLVGCKPAELPEFCCLLPAPRGANVTFQFVPLTILPVAATGVPPGVLVFALAFVAVAAAAAVAAVAAAAASMFGGGGVGVCNIIALLGESWVR
jgi:hypothetical protein